MSADAIHALITKYFAAYEGRDETGCAECYASDAWVASPWGAPIHGFDAIRQSHLEWFEEGEKDKAFRVLDLRVTGDVAICLLRYDAHIPGDTEPKAIAGISLNGLKKHGSGQCCITHTSLNELQ